VDARPDLLRLLLAPLRPQRKQLRDDQRCPEHDIPSDLRRCRRHPAVLGHCRQLGGHS
jgi:hypothetical protein